MRNRRINDGFINPRPKSWATVLLLASFLLLLAVMLIPGEANAQCSKWSNKNVCESKGCYWWNNSCHADHPATCAELDNENDCVNVYHCYWYNNACWSTPQTACDGWTGQSDCEAHGCYWYNGACYDVIPSCEILNNETDCTKFGCYWYDGACHADPPAGPTEGEMMPCVVPPFLAESVPPNVMIILQNSSSMMKPAYNRIEPADPYIDLGSYNPNIAYYGLAIPDSHYYWDGDCFLFDLVYDGICDAVNKKFSGNFLNWLLSRRIDIAAQVLLGGKGTSRQLGGGRKVIRWGDWATNMPLFKKYYWGDDALQYLFKITSKVSVCDAATETEIYNLGNQPPEIEVTDDHGILHEIMQKVRVGIELVNDQDSDGGDIVLEIKDNTPIASVYTTFQNMKCYDWAPIGECLYEVGRYYQGTCCYYSNKTFDAPTSAWCQSQFCILLSDGESSYDYNIPAEARDADSYDVDPIPSGYTIADYPFNIWGSDYLNDVALWCHNTDFRTLLDGDQNVILYPVFCFGTEPVAREILLRAAKNGGFTDSNGNDYPDLVSEWDGDADGLPDNFYEAYNGYQLKEALRAIIIDILNQTSAAAAVSVVSTSDKGEGNVFQAYFSPLRPIAGVDLTWIGELHALWIDQIGNLREDTNQDEALSLDTDRILHIYYSSDSGRTIVERWRDNDGDCEEDAMDDMVTINDVLSVWRAGEGLWNTLAADRNIRVIVPVESGPGLEMIEFKKGAAHTPRIAPHLDYGVYTAEKESLINYIRGIDYGLTSDWRNRTADSKVWKLSDIINSSPTFVGPPADRYDLIYNDASYRSFFQQYKNRQGVVYVGANDGMLHAFNAGRYIETGNPVNRGYLDDMGDNLGEELMAVVPFNMLPHLKWLARTDYCHVYYVDLKPKVFDARIFSVDSKHPGGWGTILICGMRLGETEYEIPGYDPYYSAYLALDVTDPNDIEFMWEEKDTGLAFTTSYPGVAKVGDKWLRVVGSGPTSLYGDCEQQSTLYIVNVDDLTDTREFTGTTDSHFGDAAPIDVDLDGNVDVIYIGESCWDGNSWFGKLHKVNTYESTVLSDWTMTTFMTVPGPITAGGGSTMDESGHVWLYFGTGRHFSDYDESDLSDQCFFGVKDPDWNSPSSVSFSSLLNVSAATIQQTDTGTYVYDYYGTPQSYDSLLVDMSSAAGWKTILVDGERVINRPLVIGGVVFFTTYVPYEEICSFGGSSRLYGVDFRTGVPGETSILGTDEDGWLFEFVELGEGVPSAPAAHVGITDEAMIAVQLSTGAISQQEATIASPKSKGLFWRGK